MSKEYGGLGLPNLRDLNICLLASWLRRYEQDRNKLWKERLDYKYNTSNVNIFRAKSVGASPFFLEALCGQLMQQKRAIGGSSVMVKRLDFGRTTG
jgi:hypothetical protein